MAKQPASGSRDPDEARYRDKAEMPGYGIMKDEVPGIDAPTKVWDPLSCRREVVPRVNADGRQRK